MWGRPLAPKPELDASDEARQQAAVAHSGLLPRAVISQQQNQSHDQGATMQYYNIPPPQPDRAFYPSMDPQRMGALVPTQDPNGPTGSGANKSEKQQQGQHFAFQAMHQPHGQYHQQYYPPFGYMHQRPPPYQQYPPPPYHSAMPPPQPPPVNQQYQHSAPSSSTPSGSTPSGSAVPSGSAPPVPTSSGSAPSTSSQQ